MNHGKILLEAELDHLLGEDIESAKNRERTAFDRLTEPFGKSLVLFGAGNLGRNILGQLRSVGIEPLAFADNNPSLWGKSVDGIEVLPPNDAALKFGQQATFIITIWNPGSNHQFKITKQRLQSLNCMNVISFMSFFWKYHERYLPNCFVDLPHKIIEERDDVRKVFNLWEDQASKSIYNSNLKWRILDSFDDLLSSSSEIQYFPNNLKLLKDESFIDCGAYNGDTIKTFITKTNNLFSSIHAFEPDPLNFEKLSEFVSTLIFKEKISLYKKAVGARFEEINFSNRGTDSSKISANGRTKVDSVPLDDILVNCVPTFIKMDIEGAEIDALHGAKKIIRKFLPVMAICVYHQQDHLWKIPLLIKSFSSEYHLFLRAHREEGWDLVCYALPSKRLII